MLSGRTWVRIAILSVALTRPAWGSGTSTEPAFHRAWLPPTENNEANAADQAFPGEPSSGPATPRALSLRWRIGGDANGNAEVAVAYRRAGEHGWRAALPLFWVHPDMAPPSELKPGGRLFAGSIFDLHPDTQYEVRLDLTDTDGGSGTRLLDLRTAPEPRAPEGMRIVQVAPSYGKAGPGQGTGAPDDPIVGLAQALQQAEAGDILVLAPGTYPITSTISINRSVRGRPGGHSSCVARRRVRPLSTVAERPFCSTDRVGKMSGSKI